MALQWNIIKQKYPEAYNFLYEWVDKTWDARQQRPHTYAETGLTFTEDNLRLLYDFFDEQKILVSVYWYSIESKWWLDILFEGSDRNIHRETDIETRTEAEEKAFEKAFEILENQLIKGE